MGTTASRSVQLAHPLNERALSRACARVGAFWCMRNTFVCYASCSRMRLFTAEVVAWNRTFPAWSLIFARCYLSASEGDTCSFKNFRYAGPIGAEPPHRFDMSGWVPGAREPERGQSGEITLISCTMHRRVYVVTHSVHGGIGKYLLDLGSSFTYRPRPRNTVSAETDQTCCRRLLFGLPQGIDPGFCANIFSL